jgi:oligopeptide transport system permease protein
MLKIILQRFIQGVMVIFCLYTITFFLVRQIPGDVLQGEKSMKPETRLEKLKHLQLDKNHFHQYRIFTLQKLQGDFNESFRYKRPVIEVLKESFPVSVSLGIPATLMALAVGIPAGILAALRKNSFIDYGTMTIAMLGITVPSFVIAPTIALQIAKVVPIFKVAGWGGPLDWVLPSICLGAATAAYVARITRAGMNDVLNQDYIRTARAKGVSEVMVILKHALKGGLIPAIAYIGPAFAALITGSFIIETIFQVPGMGQHFIKSISSRDTHLMEGLVIFFGILIVCVNLAADIALVLLNPRLRKAE